MQRRELMDLIAAATGCALLGAAPAAQAVRANAVALSAPARDRHPFSAADVAFLDEVAETILPRTDTPGAKDARVGAFIARYARACCDDAQLAALRAARATFDLACRQAHGKGFLQASAAQRQAVLEAQDAAARAQVAAAKPGDAPHPYTLVKQLTILGYFTSKAGSRAIRYVPVPGPYIGCVPYRGEPYWSW